MRFDEEGQNLIRMQVRPALPGIGCIEEKQYLALNERDAAANGFCQAGFPRPGRAENSPMLTGFDLPAGMFKKAPVAGAKR